MKYSRIATENFAKNINKKECLEPIDKLILKEGLADTDATFKANELVLNMDCVEGKVASMEKRSPNKSMDSAFITEDAAGNQEIVFVEYRFNYSNLSNLKRNDLLDKVAGSTLALGNPVNIHNTHYFVFNSNLKQQAINRFNRMNPAMPQHYQAINMADIKHQFFD